MTPAPRKPMAVTKLEALRSGLLSVIKMEKVVNKNEPRQIRIIVRNPADLLRSSRSAPIKPPTTTTSNKRKSKVSIVGIRKKKDLMLKNSSAGLVIHKSGQ